MMIIDYENDQIYVNRTSLYLKFVINDYPNKDIILINNFYKKAWAIGDKYNDLKGNHIYLLVKSNKNSKKNITGNAFQKMLDRVREIENYVDDYPFNLKANLHVIVLNITSEYKSAYENFKAGKFKSMYSKNEINSFQIKSDKIRGVLLKPDIDVFHNNIQAHFNVGKDVTNGLPLIKEEADLPLEFFIENEIL